MFDQIVAARRGDDLLVVDVTHAPELQDGRPVASELIGVNNLWNVVFTKQFGKEGSRRFGITVSLTQDVEHEPVPVDRAPQPMPNAIDARTDLIQMPAGTPPGFLLAQGISEQRPKFDRPFPERLMADLHATLVQQFLDIPVAEGKAVVQPH